MGTSTIRLASSVPGEQKHFRLTRFRLYALAVLAVLATLAGVSVWHMRSLEGLPDVGDPFDVARCGSRSRFQMNRMPTSFMRKRGGWSPRRPREIWRVKWEELTWSKAGTSVHDFLEANRPALELWRRGTERPDAIYHQPGKIAADTALALVDDLRMLGRLAGVEGSRLEGQGAMGEAWSWYKGMVRASRHVGRHGVIIERAVGASMTSNTRPRGLTNGRPTRGWMRRSCAGHWRIRWRPTR